MGACPGEVVRDLGKVSGRSRTIKILYLTVPCRMVFSRLTLYRPAKIFLDSLIVRLSKVLVNAMPRHVMFAAVIGYSVGGIVSCSFVTPNLKITNEKSGPLNNFSSTDNRDSMNYGVSSSGTQHATVSNLENQAFMTSFRSCFSPPNRLPNPEARTRQLFLGWSDVLLRKPVHFKPDWNGFAVTGTLDSIPLSAIAISTKDSEPGCIQELIAFNTETSSNDPFNDESLDNHRLHGESGETSTALSTAPSMKATLREQVAAYLKRSVGSELSQGAAVK